MSSTYYINEISRIIKYIESHIQEPLTVKSICKESLFSQWEFQRVFRAFVGDSVGGYLRGRRLSLAARDLQESNMKIIEIAFKYQFSSQESFSRSFKQHFGHTPGLVKNEKILLSSMVKPELNEKRIEQISKNICRSPVIDEIKEKKLVGMKTTFESTLGSDKSSYEGIRSHWLSFDKRRSEIHNVVEGHTYGLISSPKGDFNQDQLEYFSCVEVETLSSIPNGMDIIKTKNQEYAIFEVITEPESCHIIADFVYGIWLPQSGHRRGEGADIEIFENKSYEFNDAESRMHYCIPIIQ